MPYLLLQSLTDFLVLVLCNVNIILHLLNKPEEQLQITLLEGENSDLSFEWRGPGAHCVAMEMSQWRYHESLW